ncbi:MAG: cysteine desulfurase family protein [Rhodothermales bacterium]
MKLPIYLDYNATTPVDQRVLGRMLPYFTERYGNASSKGHPFGWVAEEAVEQAREAAAAGLGAEPGEIVFTSGATEAVNAALKGVAGAYAHHGSHVVTVQTEHKAVLDACRALERQGMVVTYLPVHPNGLLDLDALDAVLTDETILVAVMWANNETGVIQPIPEIARRVRSRGIVFMTDATQAVGKVPVSVEHADVLVCSGHKIYGPKGVGALYLRRRNPRVRLVPMIDGGGQERGLRGGTLNVPGIVGLGAAMEIAQVEMETETARLQTLRDRLEAALRDRVPNVHVNGLGAPRLPQTANVTFRGVQADKLMPALRDLAVSTGSACSSGSDKPSHVLKAMGLNDEEARSTIRFSLGRFTPAEEIDYAIEHILNAVERLRRQAVVVHDP